jgi:hypothetical protein
MAAIRVSFTWLGVRKALTPTQKAQAAETFGADGPYLSAAKKLLDTRCPAFRAVTAVRNRTVGYWKSMSLPYPEPGVRLIRQDYLEPFNERMTHLRDLLHAEVEKLDRQLPYLRQAAEERLGSLYDPADYPPSLVGLFALDWDFPSVEPPDYLLQLNPSLYEQERRRMMSRFEEAITMAEQAFTEELGKLVGHLVERLDGTADGKPKVFRDSAVSNLQEFFQQFRMLNVRSNAELDRLVGMAERMVRGVTPQRLRDSQSLREQVVSELSAVQKSLDGLLVDRPRRRILRTARTEEPAA